MDAENGPLEREAPTHPPLMRQPAYLSYLTVRTSSVVAVEMVSVTVGWQIYDLTRNPFDLGLVGLTQFIPSLALFLITGALTDRYSRTVITTLSIGLVALCSGGLVMLSLTSLSVIWPIFAVMVLLGIGRMFFNTALRSLLPNLVPARDLVRAISMTAGIGKCATVLGPLAGGMLYGISPTVAYAAAMAFLATSFAASFWLPRMGIPASQNQGMLESLIGGLRYIFSQRIVFGAISLDMVAVLLGGAVALMPVFARDILEVGPIGLGLLRAAPAIGGITTAFILAWRPMRDHAGPRMLATVAIFGAAVTVFGLSTTLWLSVASLAVMGAADMVSVTIRQTLIQIWTPDEMRGRMAAANTVFLGVSNEVGEFRAGTMAALIGAVPAVALGGVGAMAAAGLWALWFPELRKVRSLERRS